MLNQPNDKGLIDVEMADVPAQQQQLTFIERNNFSCLIYGLIAFAILLVTGCIVYSNTLGAPFVFDDIRSINDNIYIRMTAFTPEQIARIGNSPLSRPVANFSFALNYYFHQYHPAGYHIVNILIHVTVAFLVFLIAFQTLCLCKTESIFKTSLLAGLIWLAHPLHTQSVTYVVQRMSSLAAMFYLLALFCYVKARMIRKDSRGASIKKVVLFSTVILAGVLGVGSKPIVITLPVLLFLYEWLFLKRLDSLWLRTSFRRLMILVAVLLLFSFFYLDVGLYDAIQATYDAQNFSMGTRLLTELQIIIYYSSLLVFPHPSRLNLDYDYPLSQSLLAPPATIFSLMAILSLLLIAFYLAKRHRLVVFTIFWFLTTLIVESSFIGLAPLFEHRTYLPSVFPVIVIITLFSQVAISRSIKTSLLIVLFCIGALWTYQRNAVWTDAIYLWENCVQKSPLKARPHYNLGLALQSAGYMESAMQYYYKAIALEPESAIVYNRLGMLNAQKGHYKQARRYLEKALKSNIPNTEDSKILAANIYTNFGSLYFLCSDYQKALRFTRLALTMRMARFGVNHPQTLESYSNLAAIYKKRGEIHQALLHYQKALKICREIFSPDHPQTIDIYRQLAFLNYKTEQYYKAEQYYNTLLRLQTNAKKINHEMIATVYLDLGATCQKIGKKEEAVRHYRKALSIYEKLDDGPK